MALYLIPLNAVIHVKIIYDGMISLPELQDHVDMSQYNIRKWLGCIMCQFLSVLYIPQH